MLSIQQGRAQVSSPRGMLVQLGQRGAARGAQTWNGSSTRQARTWGWLSRFGDASRTRRASFLEPYALYKVGHRYVSIPICHMSRVFQI